jgi:hypothetical protein
MGWLDHRYAVRAGMDAVYSLAAATQGLITLLLAFILETV